MPRVDRSLVQPGGALLVIVAAAVLVPEYWLFLATSALVSAIVLLGLGVVGRAGMNSLCALSFAAVGAWTVARLSVWDVPGACCCGSSPGASPRRRSGSSSDFRRCGCAGSTWRSSRWDSPPRRKSSSPP
ncbi:hypothetical protein [Actinomadura sp. J1-007]|uniref:hypothetical protein n=1 Tax=Actinomadura sp. J1-007 TaxID=2661913 RepID=UPI0028164CCF|nr:hypothetical protein [Actinomadura sp. J1-007]